MIKKFMLLCIAVSLFLPATQAEDADFTAAKAILDSYVETGKIAGAVVLVTKDGKDILQYATGMRDIASGDKLATDDLFRIASQTKAITSVGIMILAERGLLKVTDPISTYWPAFKDTSVLIMDKEQGKSVVPAKREITIHDLLTHSAGIGYGWGPNQQAWAKAGLFDWYFADIPKPMPEALTAITDLPFDAQPGEQFVYGHNTDILGALIERISGKSLRAFFRSEILGPLKMQDTDFIVPADKLDRLATVYGYSEGKLYRAPDANKAMIEDGAPNYMVTQGHYTNPALQAFSGGAGLVSTASDYTRFLQMLMHGGTLDGVQILSTDSVAQMTRDQIPNIKMDWNDGFGYAFSLSTYKKGDHKGKVAEYGWGGAYHSQYYVRPIEKITVSYMIQLIPTDGIKDWDHLSAAVKISLGIDP